MSYEYKDIVVKIIYLPEIKFSCEISESCINQGKKFGINIIPFKGIHGYNSKSVIEKYSLKPKYFFKQGRRGVLGCFLSHYLLWLECMKLNKPYLILEHDGYFMNELPKNILDNFEEVIKLDNESPYNSDYDEKVNKKHKLSITKYLNPKTKNTELNETGNYMHGAYSYLIKPIAAKKIISWINKNGFLPADIQIGDKLVDIRVIKPTIVRLHPFYSNRVERLSLTRTII